MSNFAADFTSNLREFTQDRTLAKFAEHAETFGADTLIERELLPTPDKNIHVTDTDGVNLFYYGKPEKRVENEKAVIYRTPLDTPRKSDGSLDTHVVLEYPLPKDSFMESFCVVEQLGIVAVVRSVRANGRLVIHDMDCDRLVLVTELAVAKRLTTFVPLHSTGVRRFALPVHTPRLLIEYEHDVVSNTVNEVRRVEFELPPNIPILDFAFNTHCRLGAVTFANYAPSRLLNAKLRTKCTLKMPRFDSWFTRCAVCRFGLCLFFDETSSQIELYDANGHNLKCVAMQSAEWRIAQRLGAAPFVRAWTAMQIGDELRIVFVQYMGSIFSVSQGDVERITMRRALKVRVRASTSQNVATVTDSRAGERCELLFSYEDARVTHDQNAVTLLGSLFDHGGHFYFVDPANNCLKETSRPSLELPISREMADARR